MIGGEEEARTGMKVEHGERMGRNSCLLSKGEGKKKKKGTQSKKPPFPFHTKKWKLVSLQGWVLLFRCFYSNSSYVLIFTDLKSYYYAISKKNKNRQKNMTADNHTGRFEDTKAYTHMHTHTHEPEDIIHGFSQKETEVK